MASTSAVPVVTSSKRLSRRHPIGSTATRSGLASTFHQPRSVWKIPLARATPAGNAGVPGAGQPLQRSDHAIGVEHDLGGPGGAELPELRQRVQAGGPGARGGRGVQDVGRELAVAGDQHPRGRGPQRGDERVERVELGVGGGVGAVGHQDVGGGDEVAHEGIAWSEAVRVEQDDDRAQVDGRGQPLGAEEVDEGGGVREAGGLDEQAVGAAVRAGS
jgi:hypothetical protein